MTQKIPNVCKHVTCYTISWIAHPFWFVLAFNLLEDRHIDDITFKNICFYYPKKTNRFCVAVGFYSHVIDLSLMSKCGKSISDTPHCISYATFLLLVYFDVSWDLLLNRRMATWNLFVNPLTLKISFSYSPYCLPYSSCDVSLENLVLDQLIIPQLIFFFILITCLLDIVLIL